MHSDRVHRTDGLSLGWALLSWVLLALWLVAPLAAQQSGADAPAADTQRAAADTATLETLTDSLVGAGVSLGRHEATLSLELSDGRTVEIAFEDGRVVADGERLGDYEEGGPLDRSWRRLLDDASMATSAELPVLLREWQPPVGAGPLGDRLDDRIEAALSGVGGRMVDRERFARTDPERDSIDKLLARVHELERMESREHRAGGHEWGYLDRFLEGLATLFGVLVWLGVGFAIGAALLFFGGGRIERLAETVSQEPLRAALIGLAGAFLWVPFFVLVTLALLVSVIGIPLIIAWAPLFPMLTGLAAVVGWIAVAYGAGDALVSRKLRETSYFRDAGSFRSMGVGIALLLSPFFIGALFEMTVFLEWLGDLLFVLGMLANILVTSIGFGAVLIRLAASYDRHRQRRAAEKRALAAQEETQTHV